MKIKPIFKSFLLLIFFIMLFSSGGAHTILAVIVSVLVIFHVIGNIKMLKNLRKEYEDKINKLQAEHKAQLEKLNK